MRPLPAAHRPAAVRLRQYQPQAESSDRRQPGDPEAAPQRRWVRRQESASATGQPRSARPRHLASERSPPPCRSASQAASLLAGAAGRREYFRPLYQAQKRHRFRVERAVTSNRLEPLPLRHIGPARSATRSDRSAARCRAHRSPHRCAGSPQRHRAPTHRRPRASRCSARRRSVLPARHIGAYSAAAHHRKSYVTSCRAAPRPFCRTAQEAPTWYPTAKSPPAGGCPYCSEKGSAAGAASLRQARVVQCCARPEVETRRPSQSLRSEWMVCPVRRTQMPAP